MMKKIIFLVMLNILLFSALASASIVFEDNFNDYDGEDGIVY